MACYPAHMRRRGPPLLLAAIALAGCSEEAAPGGAPPDVLLVTVDTLRADHLGAYGMPGGVSPAVDTLARRGHVFERAIAAAPSTVPSHASILTSRYPRQHSVGYGNGNTRLAEPSLAEHFQAAGRATAAFVGNAMLQRRVGLDRGFEVYDDELPAPEGNRALIFERVAPDTTERALAWLAGERDRPVFLWLHLQDPHGPYTPPADVLADVPAPGPAAGETELPVLASDAGWHGIPRYQALEGLRRPSEYRHRYAAEVRFADASIGRVLDALDERAHRRRAADPIVLLTADHGESLGEQDRWFAHSHATTPDLAHVPLVLAAPGVPPGRSREPVSHVDVLPTLLALSGLPVPPEARGVPLAPVARGEASLPERWVYCDMGSELSAYRGDRFVRGRGLAGAWQGGDGAEALWSSFHWRSGRPQLEWSRAATGPGAELPPAVAAYARDAVPMQPAAALDDVQQRRLRALGYLE